ncbi:molybdate ABC transporter ATP-binding protein ModF [Zobellella denitrificans]|uniref:Molybdenum ABC transporter ATP-binding protein n=1 Tax=Zobellella denitrificans TaxID=347534 RepID=A0A231MYW1_9GAMM|nr:molybdate ABC transporter ATP-binding protein ModF [Zobellella denitrificans]ATG73719.1 molybdenum ABC transporter ATP-binding protein [Zobellella denitrificans]OXS15431.1 molybdate ABC transporter ATP-binding protein ModF [Zobellella denitrificans]
MTAIRIRDARFAISERHRLTIRHLDLEAGQCWSFVGANGSGKTALARALAGELRLLEGEADNGFGRIEWVSFEQLQQLADREREEDESDLLDYEDQGHSARQIILEGGGGEARLAALAERFGITGLLDRGFKYLSTGETRKVLLCRALLREPALLILDEPFDGLDVTAHAGLMRLLEELVAAGQSLVLILNRFEEIPDFADRLGLVAECELGLAGPRDEVVASAELLQLTHLAAMEQAGQRLPPADPDAVRRALDDREPRILMRDIKVSYGDKRILDGLNWQVNPGEHWQIVGPNGAGKSTLLSLVTGDHPQGYSNDLTLFGRRRGSGESIWDIKQHIGYVSTSMQQDYRVTATPRSVILSGFFDSIGVYQQPGDRQLALAGQWLALLGLERLANEPFRNLSYGQQRLLLIARAMVKHPPILILDEPLQGLDTFNRHWVKRWIDLLVAEGGTQLLFVSHHQEDAPACISHRLSFIPEGEGHIYRSEALQGT